MYLIKNYKGSLNILQVKFNISHFFYAIRLAGLSTHQRKKSNVLRASKFHPHANKHLSCHRVHLSLKWLSSDFFVRGSNRTQLLIPDFHNKVLWVLRWIKQHEKCSFACGKSLDNIHNKGVYWYSTSRNRLAYI